MLFVLILNLLPSNSHLDSSCSWKILCVGYVEIQWEVVEESARHTQVCGDQGLQADSPALGRHEAGLSRRFPLSSNWDISFAGSGGEK